MIGYVELSRAFVARIEKVIPHAQLVEIESYSGFFEGYSPEVDALLLSAESGSAYTLMYPDFEVVIPTRRPVTEPLIYAIGHQDASMREFLNHWTSLRKKDGITGDLYDQWILGKTAEDSRPRWSVIRDVLHWVD